MPAPFVRRLLGKKRSRIVVYDTFTDVDNTPLANHIPDVRPNGAVWDPRVAGWEVLNNKCYNDPAANNARCVIDSGVSDCTITVNQYIHDHLADHSVHQDGIVFRYQDDSNWWFARISEFNQRMEIVLYTGSFNTLAQSGITVVAGTVYPLKVVLKGSNIRFTFNNQVTIAAVNSTLATRTRHGLFAYYGPTLEVADNFKITVP